METRTTVPFWNKHFRDNARWRFQHKPPRKRCRRVGESGIDSIKTFLAKVIIIKHHLVIEGTSAEWAGLGVSREALQGALVTLMLIFDVPVFRSTEPAESARLIHYIGSQFVLCAQLKTALESKSRAAQEFRTEEKLVSCRSRAGP